MAKSEQISAKVTGGETVTVENEMPENIEQAVEEYGDEIVFSRFRASLVIDIQAFMRSYLKGEDPKTQDEIQTLVDDWRPGVKARGKSPTEKAKDLFSKLSAEQKAELLAELA